MEMVKMVMSVTMVKMVNATALVTQLAAQRELMG
jgi:hypothetical protein